MREAVVLGAGMAGMACARMLAKLGHRPLLIAPDDDVPNRGETLSGAAYPILETLGWLDLLGSDNALTVEDRYSIWGAPRLTRDVATGWHIDRRRLEGCMSATLAEDGVDRLIGTIRQASSTPDGVALELDDGGRIEARFVADCTGRASVTSAPASGRRRLDRLTACCSLFDLSADAEPAAATLIEAVAGGWWYTSVLPGRRLFVAFFSDSDLMPAGLRKRPAIWAEMIGAAGAASERLHSLGVTLNDAPRDIASACSVVSPRVVDGRIVRAGDAAAALDPLGSNGLATALWSGVQTARGIDGLLGGDAAPAARYESAFLEGILSHLATQKMMYASERRFAEEAFWKRRNGQDQRRIGAGMS